MAFPWLLALAPFIAPQYIDIFNKISGATSAEEKKKVEMLAKAKKLDAEAAREMFTREIRQTRLDELSARGDRLWANGPSAFDMKEAEVALQAVSRGSRIADIMPAGMSSTGLLSRLRERELESLRKLQEPRGDRTREQIMGENTGVSDEDLVRSVRGLQVGGEAQ